MPVCVSKGCSHSENLLGTLFLSLVSKSQESTESLAHVTRLVFIYKSKNGKKVVIVHLKTIQN